MGPSTNGVQELYLRLLTLVQRATNGLVTIRPEGVYNLSEARLCQVSAYEFSLLFLLRPGRAV